MSGSGKVSSQILFLFVLAIGFLLLIYTNVKIANGTAFDMTHEHNMWKSIFKGNDASVDEVWALNTQDALTDNSTVLSPYKNILLWDSVSWFALKTAGNVDACGKCYITRDKKKIAEINTGAVLVEWSSNPQKPPGKTQRRQDQLYVWWSMEGPSIAKGGDPQRFKLYPNGFFNATLSFRRDSTFYNPVWIWFGNISIVNLVKTRFGGIENNLDKLLLRKSKVAAWMVSNCGTGSNAKRRITFAQELVDNGLKLERFGRCFPKSGSTPKRNTPEFFRFLEPYKFYMSFENAIHCTDYITEKFEINALAAGVVPVVMGAAREEYEAIAPPHSFIHVDDFPTAKKLVEYLDYLDKNATAYAAYLAWRTMDPYELFPYGRHIGFCQLCRTMYGVSPDDHRPFAEIYNTRNASYPSNRPIKQYRFESIYDWWHASQTQECLG